MKKCERIACFYDSCGIRRGFDVLGSIGKQSIQWRRPMFRTLTPEAIDTLKWIDQFGTGRAVP